MSGELCSLIGFPAKTLKKRIPGEDLLKLVLGGDKLEGFGPSGKSRGRKQNCIDSVEQGSI